MSRAMAVLVVGLVLGASGLVYVMAQNNEAQREKINALEAERAGLHETLAGLEAELAYQERPDAIGRLAQEHLDLEALDPLQMVTLEEAEGLLGGDLVSDPAGDQANDLASDPSRGATGAPGETHAP